MRPSLAERFWSRVDRSAGPLGCWLWMGTRKRGSLGYGAVTVREAGVRRVLFPHRLSWALTLGPVPSGALVLHSCDVPFCVNPAHLRLGTQADNVHDAQARGRYRNGRTKLTLAQLALIRSLARPFNAASQARRCGISRRQLMRVWKGEGHGNPYRS